MKKIVLGMLVSSVIAMADATTIDATMKLMNQGLQEVQSGFVYNNKDGIIRGVETIQSANSIFTHVDVASFIPNNSKVQVTKNINESLSKDLEALKKAVENKQYADATKKYAKVVNDCMACHTIVRGW